MYDSSFIGWPLQVVLILGSLLTILFMMRRIRQSKLQIQDSIFWIIFSFLLLVLSIFPELTSWVSQKLEIASPINFVYLVIIFVLLINQFLSSVRISRMDARLQQLAQRQALDEKYRAEAGAAPAADENTGASAASEEPAE
ncbi:DUF2304 domain-containing protein [Ruminococcaceae bacterium OttesenSCG-928-D13]|nr:DUF2304 domain-containing protein [Ruminococcaceae bacterium OttesenSCG-928-D13]